MSAFGMWNLTIENHTIVISDIKGQRHGKSVTTPGLQTVETFPTPNNYAQVCL